MEYLYVGMGGVVGAVLRGTTCILFDKFWKKEFPLAVLVINVLGCMIIGIVSEIDSINRQFSLAITAGFCGGFTTWSTFAAQTLKLGTKKQYVLLVANIVLNHLLAGVAAYIGQIIGRACAT